jgi:hypothetical protein
MFVLLPQEAKNLARTTCPAGVGFVPEDWDEYTRKTRESEKNE